MKIAHSLTDVRIRAHFCALMTHLMEISAASDTRPGAAIRKGGRILKKSRNVGESVYVFLSVVMFAVLTAVNIESNWRFLEIEGIAAMLWIMVELICGLVRDFVEIVRENEEERRG